MKTLIKFTTLRFRVLIVSALGGFALCPMAHAVTPAPDGAYPGGNTAEGQASLASLTTGTYNTALGLYSLLSLTDGKFNTGVGAATLLANTGSQNTAVGTGALFNNTTDGNTAIGAFALFGNNIGSGNTAMGLRALESNAAGQRNTAIGTYALNHNISNFNTAIGYQALVNNGTGFENTAIGNDSLALNTSGQDNTACGSGALSNNTGNFNNAFGRNALVVHTNGDGNVAVGDSALSHDTVGSNNTAIGNSSLLNNIGGSFNIALGVFAGQDITGGNNINIGANVTGPNGEDNTIRIGNNNHIQTFIAGIWNQIGGTQAVYVDTDGRLGLQVSSQRFKDEIKPMDQASEVIYDLQPVSFRYKAEIDRTRSRGFGLIAEEVEKVSPDLVIRGGDSRANSVRYDAVNAMLLNEFLKEHKKVEEQQATIAELKSTVARQEKRFAQQEEQIDGLTSGLKKVSAQLEMSKLAPRVVLNNP